MPEHVGLLMHSVLPRGGVVHTLELAQALARGGTRVSVFAPVEPGQALFRPLPAMLPLDFVPLPMPTPRGTTLADQVGERIDALARTLPAALAARPTLALLHAQDSLNGAALARLRPPLPWLRTVHHLDDFADPRLAAWQDQSWRRAQAVCCVSDHWLDRLRSLRGLPGSPPVHRVANGVDLVRFTPAPAPTDASALAALGLDDAPLVLAVGGVEARKNSARLLAAFARLRQQLPAAARARLVVAGGASLLPHGDEQRRWRDTLAATGLDEGAGQSVWRTGPLPDAALPALMRHARVLAMPSLMEGFGLVALEALACGTPVLVSRRAPFTEHLGGEPGVAWCEPEDVDSLAQGLARAWAQPRLAAPPPVCRRHGWDASARRHRALYRSVLQECVACPP